MPFVQWSGGVQPKIHITSIRQKTLCGHNIPAHATESTNRPREKTKLCMLCQKIEQENKRFEKILR